MPLEPENKGFAIKRRYEKVEIDGSIAAAENLKVGDLILVTLDINIPNERETYLAIDDALPAIFEAVNPEFKTSETQKVNAAREALEAQLSADPSTADLVLQVSVYPAVPMSMQRVADVERAQMLLESPNRMALQKMLWHLHAVLHRVRSQPEHKGVIRWLVDVDPQAI
jgi:hypothetical protein